MACNRGAVAMRAPHDQPTESGDEGLARHEIADAALIECGRCCRSPARRHDVPPQWLRETRRCCRHAAPDRRGPAMRAPGISGRRPVAPTRTGKSSITHASAIKGVVHSKPVRRSRSISSGYYARSPVVDVNRHGNRQGSDPFCVRWRKGVRPLLSVLGRLQLCELLFELLLFGQRARVSFLARREFRAETRHFLRRVGKLLLGACVVALGPLDLTPATFDLACSFRAPRCTRAEFRLDLLDLAASLPLKLRVSPAPFVASSPARALALARHRPPAGRHRPALRIPCASAVESGVQEGRRRMATHRASRPPRSCLAPTQTRRHRSESDGPAQSPRERCHDARFRPDANQPPCRPAAIDARSAGVPPRRRPGRTCAGVSSRAD